MEKPVHEALDSNQLELWRLQKERAAKMEKALFTYEVITLDDGRFGYTIFIDGETYLEQKTIPSITEKKGFGSKEDAEKIADLVITKIRSGQSPPVVTRDDLRRSGITD